MNRRNRFKKTDLEKAKLVIFTLFVIELIVLNTMLILKISRDNKMVKAQEKQMLAIQKVIQEKPEENKFQEILVDCINIEKVKPEDIVEFDNKVIEIPKTKMGKVGDSEDAEKKTVDSSTSSAQQMTAEEVINKYESNGTSIGIDVSSWQQNINWSEVKKQGIEFAMIRVGYRGSTLGSIYMDPYFEKNIKGAISNGIYVGIYFFSMAINEEEALQEAAWVVNTIKNYKITYPIAYDFESFGVNRAEGLSNEQMNKNAVAFLKYVRSKGYQSMMYGSKNALNTRWNMRLFSSDKVWLAHYTTSTNYSGRYNMWQHTDKGSVNGINGAVDLDIAYFKYSSNKQEIHDEPIWDTFD